MIDNETLSLMVQPEEEKYDDSISPITREYEVITTFMKIHNISATWEPLDPYGFLIPANSSYQLLVGSYFCVEGQVLECCPPM